MIYRYLVVSKAANTIDLDSVNDFRAGGIEIAILLTNRKVPVYHPSNEAQPTTAQCFKMLM
jgi:hypothetical protein